MIRSIITGAIVGPFVLFVMLWTGFVYAGPKPDPFSQRDFPCQEDQALAYAPQFGPDRVGCIQIDDLVDERLP